VFDLLHLHVVLRQFVVNLARNLGSKFYNLGITDPAASSDKAGLPNQEWRPFWAGIAPGAGRLQLDF
jgi:hypothetical protein